LQQQSKGRHTTGCKIQKDYSWLTEVEADLKPLNIGHVTALM